MTSGGTRPAVAPLAAAAALGCTAAAAALTTGEPPILIAGAVAAALVLAAVGTGWRWLGSGSVGMVTAVVAVSAAVEPDRLPAPALVAASAVLIAYVAMLDQVERPGRSRPRVTLFRGRPAARVLAPLLSLVAAAAVAAIAVQPVVPSIWLVVIGLASCVGALVLATRAR